MMSKLSVKLDGLHLNNPLMPASGPLVGDLNKLNYMMNQGVGALVTKTISTTAAKVPRPCIYGDKTYVMNSELWSEYGKETWLNDFLPHLDKKDDQPLIISVGYTAQDMEILIEKLNPYADAYEVSTHYVGKDLSSIKETVRTIRQRTVLPIYMKVSPHIPDKVAFAKAVREAGANGVVAINSLGPTLKIDPATRSIVYGGASGYVWTSGPAIKPLALATVYEIKQAMPDFTVIGVGGIASATDVVEFLMAGASAVQMLSAALIKGKDLYKKIIDDLPSTLLHYGYDSIEAVQKTILFNAMTYEKKVPLVNEERCTKCRLCEKVCPYFAIDYDGKIRINANQCFGCHLCVSRCPVNALEV